MSEKANTRDMSDFPEFDKFDIHKKDQEWVNKYNDSKPDKKTVELVRLDTKSILQAKEIELLKAQLSSRDSEIAELKADKVKLFDEMHNVVTQLGKYLLFRHPEELMAEIKSDKEWINLAIQRLDSDDLDYIQSNLRKTPKP